MKNVRKPLAAALAAVVGLLAVALGPSPAQATNHDGVADIGEFVQWWDPNFTQSCYDEFWDKSLYDAAWGDYFRSTWYCPGAGAGQRIPNNQRSVANFDPNAVVQFCTSTLLTGSCYLARRYPEQVNGGDAWFYGTLGAWDLNIESAYFL
jgi:hypothetical protein